MLTLALTNLADWREHVDMQIGPSQPIQLNYSLETPPEIKDVTPKTEENVG
jgi:hypothetical protein